MSTKLYDFYKINEKHQIVFDKIIQLRKDLQQHIGLNYQILFASYLTKLVDDIFPTYEIIKDKNNKKFSDYNTILTNILDKYYEKNQTQKCGMFDIFENSLVVYSYKNEVYIKTFFNTEFANKLFFSLFDKCEDFHYQNSTDKPDEISEEEWKIREELVDTLFIGGKFSDSGLVADFRPELWEVKWGFHKKVEILKQIPNKKYRAENISKKEIEREFFREHKESYDTIGEFGEFKKTEEYKKILEDKKIVNIEKLIDINESSFDIEYREI